MNVPFDTSVASVDKQLIEYFKDRTNPRDTHMIIIGQSFGGLVANSLHTKGWTNIKKAIYIGAPLHGARFLHQLNDKLPQFIIDRFHNQAYAFLMEKMHEDPPPHPYHTLSMGWMRFSFDGCVYKNETKFNDENHTHMSFSDHRFIFANPRLWVKVHRLVSRSNV